MSNTTRSALKIKIGHLLKGAINLQCKYMYKTNKVNLHEHQYKT